MSTSDAVEEREGDADQGSDRYRLDEVIGRGGMATVWRAFDCVAEMEVAIKVLHAHLAHDEGVVEAFEREASLIQRLDHPNIIRVFSSCEVDGLPAIVMELCGEELAARLARRERFSEDEAVDVMIKVLEALAEIHDHGFVHRDIKPQNVLFGADDEPKLIDFGVGQAEEFLASEESGQIGTVEYMAPERAEELVVDARSDVYSAGIVLFELVCGHLPYRADSAAAILRMHRDGQVPDPSVFASDLSETTRRVIMRAMAKHPEERFDGARQMLEALRGEVTHLEAPGVHPAWRRLRTSRDDDEMAASIEKEGYEWVVFVPRRLRRLAKEEGVDVDGEVEDVLSEYDNRAVLADQLGGLSGVHLLLASFNADNRAGAEATPSKLDSYGVARGLSRRGVDQILERLEERGVYARHLRRPRQARQEPSRLRYSTHLGFVQAMGSFAAVAMYGGLMGLVWMIENARAPQWASLGVLAAMSALAGALFVLIVIGSNAKEWWIGRVTRAYLADFARRPGLEEVDASLEVRHVDAFFAINSERIAASYQRAVSAALHVRDALEDRVDAEASSVSGLLDDIARLGERIAATEAEVATVRPARLAGEIRRLDQQLTAEEDVDETAALVDKKEALRRQLIDRDDAQQRLQALSQRLHDLASRLESLVHRYRSAEDDDPVVFDVDNFELHLDVDASRAEEPAAPQSSQVGASGS